MDIYKPHSEYISLVRRMEDLPKKVDVVVLGTGLPESILAAACSRSGLSVLHLDRNKYYGGAWSSFNLKTVDEWIEAVQGSSSECPSTTTVELAEGESLLKLGDKKMAKDIAYSWKQASGEKTEVKKKDVVEEMTHKEHLDKEWRRFSLDLTPKVLLACGEMVQILCDSEVARYAEFKCVDRFLCMEKKEETEALDYYPVPCSRGEIYQSKDLSMMDKRRLMMFLEFCIKWKAGRDGKIEFEDGDYEKFKDKPFAEFLASDRFRITGKLLYFVTDAIGILHPNSNTLEGLSAVCRFVDSVGRFGSSPFLVPLYGCGELPQCFCRLCAVFGGLYCLDRPIESLILKENRAVGVVVAGRRVDCDHVIMSPEYLNEEQVAKEGEWLNRSIHITNKSILKDEDDKERISLVNLAQLDPQAATRLYEAGFEACAAPKGYYVLQFTGRSSANNERDTVDAVFAAEGLKPLWSLRFSSLTSVEAKNLPENVAVVPGADASLDYTSVVKTAHDIFKSFWKDTDFLPRKLNIEQHEEEAVAPEEEQKVREEEKKPEEEEQKPEEEEKTPVVESA